MSRADETGMGRGALADRLPRIPATPGLAARVRRTLESRGIIERAERYVLLMFGGAQDTGAVHAARAREYGEWARTLGPGARWVGGHELGSVVEVLGPDGPGTIAPAERVAGYFEIEAATPEQAADIARTCPHLGYGGRVVVMTIVP